MRIKSLTQGALVFLWLLMVLPAQAASVWVSPSSQDALPGDSVGLDLYFFNDTPIAVGSVDVSYDDTRLQYGGFLANTLLIHDPASIPGIPAPVVNEDAGDTLPGRVNGLTIANFDTGLIGGNVGTLVFSVLNAAAVGNAGISVERLPSSSGFQFFTKADFDAHDFSSALTVDFTGATAEVVVTPLPPAGWLMLSAILVFALFSYRRQNSHARRGDDGLVAA